ncbi:hypothetical protein AcW1_007122 [Taiwanofungus camphoratus]|nr:hypothetical protein AcV7_005037 [Antrodia cinnamomea]KAI0952712.1 hypothetical protein AcW1_007122 [Antrodia cinnamomea]
MSVSVNGGAAPAGWSAYMKACYTQRKRPVLGSVDTDKLEQAALEKLKDRKDAFLYVFGSAGTNSTHETNRKEYAKWKIIPRMLRDVTYRNIETTIFGVRYRAPLFLAPIGVQGIVHPDAELASAAAAGQVGVPYIMSTASSRSIEAVAKANGSGPRWYQLYWPRSNDLTLSIISRVKKNGFSALVITLDTVTLGWRPHDLDTAYLPFYHGIGAHVGFTDPVFMGKFGLQPISKDDAPDFPYDPARQEELIQNGDEQARQRAFLGMKWIDETTSGVFKSWQDLKFVRENWDGPLLLKGIMSPEDAELAIDNGADGIIVSNHGGRQIDGAIPSLHALCQIMRSAKVKQAQANGKFTILFDSGIRTGSDIFKAIALGAQGILYGRPYMYALTLAGQAGVEEILRSILADFEITLGLSGYASLAEIYGKADTVLTKLD